VECQWLTGLSAGDGSALNRLALARNGCGLQIYLMGLVELNGSNISESATVIFIEH